MRYKTMIEGGTQVGSTNPPTTALKASGTQENYLFTDLTFTNTNTTTETVTIWILPSDVTPTASNYILIKKILPTKTFEYALSGNGIGEGSSLYAATTTADVVNVRAFGVFSSD